MKQQQETNRQRIMWTVLSLLSYGHYPCTISYLLYNFIFNQKKKINFLKTKYIIRKHGKSVRVATNWRKKRGKMSTSNRNSGTRHKYQLLDRHNTQA